MSVKAKGTVLATGNTADHTTATTWTPIARIKSIKPAVRSAPPIEKTVLESEVKEQEPGLPEVGDLEAVIEYAADKAGDIDALFNVPTAYRVRYPGGSGRKFTGFITSDGEDEIVNGQLITQTIKISSAGDIEFFESSAS